MSDFYCHQLYSDILQQYSAKESKLEQILNEKQENFRKEKNYLDQLKLYVFFTICFTNYTFL